MAVPGDPAQDLAARHGTPCPICGGSGWASPRERPVFHPAIGGGRARWTPHRGPTRPAHVRRVQTATLSDRTWRYVGEGEHTPAEVWYNGTRLPRAAYRVHHEHGATWIEIV